MQTPKRGDAEKGMSTYMLYPADLLHKVSGSYQSSTTRPARSRR
jgi:hypothetical protein